MQDQREATLPDGYRFYQHICQCEHGDAVHDYKVIHTEEGLKSERENLNCRYPECPCEKYVERTYSS